ncbi:hypothetical protein [Streptomyces sp. NPDC086023]|uniref:hypothetical protein n=1 Tax=Streptomyces sp. NPDC086023 TaxID=3365746 RepID=UPI0037D0CA14
MSALVRLVGGHLAGRSGRPRAVAGPGYALCKPLLLLVHTVPLIAAVLAAVLLGPWPGQALRYAVLPLHALFRAATDGVPMAAAADAVPEELHAGGPALVRTGPFPRVARLRSRRRDRLLRGDLCPRPARPAAAPTGPGRPA